MDKHKKNDAPGALWDQFQRTGSISLYLAYRNALARQKDTKDF